MELAAFAWVLWRPQRASAAGRSLEPIGTGTRQLPCLCGTVMDGARLEQRLLVFTAVAISEPEPVCMESLVARATMAGDATRR